MSERWSLHFIHVLGTAGLIAIGCGVLPVDCAHNSQPNLVGKVVDERGSAVPGARVSLEGRSEQALTDLGGHFRFGPLPAGTYVLRVRASDQDTRFRDSTLVRRDQLTEVELTLPDVAILTRAPAGAPAIVNQIPAGSIQGTVVDSNGHGLWQAYVIVTDVRQGAQTDSAGHFHIRGVPLGLHTIRVQAVGFEELDRQFVDVSDGQTTTLEIRLRPQIAKLARPEETRTGTIVGRIMSEKGEALAYAPVFVLGAQTGGQSDTSGRVVIQHVPIGNYTVRVKMVGFAQMERGVRVSEGDTTRVDFKLSPQPVRMMPLIQRGKG